MIADFFFFFNDTDDDGLLDDSGCSNRRGADLEEAPRVPCKKDHAIGARAAVHGIDIRRPISESQDAVNRDTATRKRLNTESKEQRRGILMMLQQNKQRRVKIQDAILK